MTPKEARTKWCPMVRYATRLDPSSNRWKQDVGEPHALNPVPCRCIANECMMWRTKINIDSGYCGLAGDLK